MHRDVKPDNICLNPISGIASLLDFGCMMGLNGEGYCCGGSPNYVPPELATLDIYWDEDARMAATHGSSDTYLAARVIHHLLFGVPPALDLCNYDEEDEDSFASYLAVSRCFDWSPYLVYLVSVGMGGLAQWLAACLVADPLLRPTPQQALALPFLDVVAAEVDAAVAAAMPSFIANNNAAVQLLQGLQGQECTFVAQQQQAPGAISSSNGGSSKDGFIAAVASHAALHTAAVPAVDMRPPKVVCGSNSNSSSSSGSSLTPDILSALSSSLNYSSIAVSTEASSSSCDLEQQQPLVELAVHAIAGCDGISQAEQVQHTAVQGVQGQDSSCVAHKQQAPIAGSSSSDSSSSSRDDFSAVAASNTAEQAVAVPAAAIQPEDDVCGSSSSSSGSSPTPDTPSALSSRLSCSSINVSTEASSSTCGPEQQQQQQQPFVQLAVHATADCDGGSQAEQKQQSVVQGMQGQDSPCVAHKQQAPSSSSRDGFSPVAASLTAKLAVAVQAPDTQLQEVVCGSSSSISGCSGSSATPDTPSDLSSSLIYSSIAVSTEASSGSCDLKQQQQQQPFVQLAVHETADCGGSSHAEQKQQGVVQDVQGQDYSCVAHKQQAPSSSSSSRDGFSPVAASHTAEQAAAAIQPEDDVCGSSSSSSSGSSPTPDTPSALSSRLSCMSVSTEASDSSCGLEQQQQQQPFVQPAVHAIADCDDSRKAEQKQQIVVHGLQGQDYSCVAHEQQAPSSSSSSGDGFSAVAASQTAKQAVTVQATVNPPQDDVCGSSSNSSSSNSSGSSPTPDPPSALSLSASYSSIAVSTEASSSSCELEQQQQQPTAELVAHAAAGCDGISQAEQKQQYTQGVLQWAAKLFKRLACSSDANAISSSSSDDKCSAAAASCVVKQAEAVSAADAWPPVVSGCSNTTGSSLAETRLQLSAHATDTAALIAWQRQAVAAMVVSSSSSSHLWDLLCTQPMDVMAAGRQSRSSRVWCSGQQSGPNAWPAAAKWASLAAATATAI
jgi:serine/threonine protein kinase